MPSSSSTHAREPVLARAKALRDAERPLGRGDGRARDRLVVWSQFAHALSIVALKDGASRIAAAATRPSDDKAVELARGRALFHATFDARISKDGRACASCHPDGREDGLTWSTPDGARQTPMLAGRLSTSAPFGWFGKNKTLKEHLHHTFARLGGTGLDAPSDARDLAALTAYIEAMKPPTRDGAKVDPSKVALANAGKALFYGARQGCADCHQGGAADGAQHDVGSGRDVEASLAFDTPSLEFIGGTAPYFHDGRFASLMDLLDAHDDRMGKTLHLDADQKLALAAYLETL